MDVGDNPRGGSARDGETAPNASRLSAGANSSSLDTLVATLVPVLIWSTLCIILFIGLRSRCRRVYSPRATLQSLYAFERSAKLPDGLFKWFKPFCRIPDSFLLSHGTIDGFLFFRFLRILTLIFGFGCALICPILLPIHATGGGGNTGLDILTMGNVTSKNYYYAHATVAWLYFGFVLYVVLRESLFCIHLRHVCLTSPFFADGVSARTVLVTCVPHAYLTEARLRETFGSTVRHVWLPKDTDDLQDLIKERAQTSVRLEKAEVRLIKLANMARSRALGIKKRPGFWRRRKAKQDETTDAFTVMKDEETPQLPTPPLPDVNGSVASQWIPHSSRPVHRPLANAGRRTDTIKWTRNRLKALAWRILKERNDLLLPGSDKPVIPAAFIEFASQADAQTACQTLSYHQPLYMSERHAGVRPYEVIWESLSLSWWSRMSRKFAMQAFMAVMVIFWSIPCALVGMVSNIKSLSSKISFLGWIQDLPGPILGVLTGLVPALALAWLMSLAPWIIRHAARAAGTPTLTLVEVYCQKAYIIFQIVQVFLVTTLSSAISAALTQILENPTSVTTLLSQNLPKSSNFYISYILIQGLVLGAANLVHFFDIFRYYIFPLLPHNHRRRYERYHALEQVHWGALFPVFTNLGIIGVCYACIAPIVLAFGTVGIAFLYFVFRYNVLYVFNSEVDTRGLLYPAALMQLIWGLYLAEACLIGLFALKAAAGPIGMTVALLVTTILVHRSILEALGPLLFDIPKSLSGAGSTNGNNTLLDPFMVARADHQDQQDGFYSFTDYPGGPGHTLSADIAEDDNTDHIPGAARNTDSSNHQHTDSAGSKSRYTITYTAQPTTTTTTTSPSTTNSSAHSSDHDTISNTIIFNPDSTPPRPPTENTPTGDPTKDHETARGLDLPIPAAATEPFRLEGAGPLFRTFSTALSTILTKQLNPHHQRLTTFLHPLTTHPRYLSTTSRLHRTITYLSPLYYSTSPTHMTDLTAKLRDLAPPDQQQQQEEQEEEGGDDDEKGGDPNKQDENDPNPHQDQPHQDEYTTTHIRSRQHNRPHRQSQRQAAEKQREELQASRAKDHALRYLHPSMSAPAPRLWIPRDHGGVSRQECEHNNRLGKGVVQCFDDGEWEIDERGKMRTDLEGSGDGWCADGGWGRGWGRW